MADKHSNPTIRAATAAFIKTILEQILPPIREVARFHGYAVTVHGSLSRDIDLVAVPWIEHADDPDDLVNSIRGAVAGVLGRCLIHKKDDKLYANKPQGRRAYMLSYAGFCGEIDLSVMPPLPKQIGPS